MIIRIFILISLFLLSVSSSFANIRDIPAHVLLDRNIKIVLSSDESSLCHSPTWAIMNDLRVGERQPYNSTKYVLPELSGNSVHTITLDNTNDNILSLLMELAAPLSDKYLKEDDQYDERDTFSPYLYADISAVVLSYIVRQLSNNKLDLLLLTPDIDEDYDEVLRGIELGFRLAPTYGLRLRVKDTDNDSKGYGMEFRLYPSDNTTIKFVHDDNDTEKSTGVEFKVEF